MPPFGTPGKDAVPLSAIQGPAVSLPVAPVVPVDPVAVAIDAVQAIKQDADQAALQASPVGDALLSHVKNLFQKAQDARNTNSIVPGLTITEMLLECQDRRNGVHTAKVQKAIVEQKLPDFYPPLTDRKCRDALAWWHDATVAYGEDWFQGHPTKEPDIDKSKLADITQQTDAAIAESVQRGGPPMFPAARQRMIDDAKTEEHARVTKFAEDRAEAMSELIKDAFQDFDFQSLRDSFRLNMVTFGTAFYWGPYVKNVRTPVWENGKRKVRMVPKPWTDSVSPLDMFFLPHMTTEKDHGFAFRRMKIDPSELEGFKGIPGSGWIDDNIVKAITDISSPVTETIQGDDRRLAQEGKDSSADSRSDMIWGVGHVKGSLLKTFGADFADEAKEYHVHVFWIGSHLLRVKLNWNDMEVPPVSRGVYEEVPGSISGIGLPMKMRPSQNKAIAIVLPMLHNIAFAAGTRFETDMFRLNNPADASRMIPNMNTAVKSDGTGNNYSMPATRYIDVPLKTDLLRSEYDKTELEADEESGVRKYSMGGDKVSGAGRTKGGLAMLLDASSRTLKSSMYRADKAEADLIERYADFFNEFGPEEVKGDIKIVTNGASGFFIQEVQIQQLEHMIDRLKDPVLVQILGPAVTIGLVKDLARDLRVNLRNMPTDSEIEQRIEAARQAAEQAAEQQRQQGGANNAGTPARPENESAIPAGAAA